MAAKTRQVCINYKPNDPVDIRCGGPHTLGFDFYVDSKEDPKDLEKFLREELRKAGMPTIQGMSISRPADFGTVKVWTRIGMKRCIQKEAKWMVSF